MKRLTQNIERTLDDGNSNAKTHTKPKGAKV